MARTLKKSTNTTQSEKDGGSSNRFRFYHHATKSLVMTRFEFKRTAIFSTDQTCFNTLTCIEGLGATIFDG